MNRCFIGGLSWDTTERELEAAFQPHGTILDAKVVFDRDANRSRGFGFITFDSSEGMDTAIEKMNGTELDGRVITVSKAEDKSSSTGRDRGDRDRDRDRRSGASGECFKCGNKGHWARDCHNRGRERGDRDRSDRGDRGDRDRDRERDRDRYKGSEDRYESRGSGGRSERGSDRYNPRDNGRRSGPYDRPSGGGRYSNGGSRDDHY